MNADGARMPCPECNDSGVVMLLTSSSPCSRGCKPPAASPLTSAKVDDVIAMMRDVSNYRNAPYEVAEELSTALKLGVTPRPKRYVGPGEFIDLLLNASSRHGVALTTIRLLDNPPAIEFEWKMGCARVRKTVDGMMVNGYHEPAEVALRLVYAAKDELGEQHREVRALGRPLYGAIEDTLRARGYI